MKYASINKRYTEIVNEYLLKGYVVNTNSMGGHQGEIAKIDLTDGKEIIRIYIDGFYEDYLEGVEIIVGRCTDKVTPNSHRDYSTFWSSHLEILKTERFYEIGNGSDYYVTKEEAERANKIRRERWRSQYRSSEYTPSEKAMEIAKRIVRNKFGYKRINAADVKLTKSNSGYVVKYNQKSYHLH